jgi:transposase
MWVPPEDTDPVSFHAPTRKSVALFGGVQLCSGRRVRCFEPCFNGPTFEAFLRQLLRHRTRRRRLVAVLDNAPCHHAGALTPFLEDHREVLTSAFLPPYSPQLNPIERVWKLTRRLCTHNQYFPQLEGLIQAVDSQLERWEKPNPVLYKLCGIT